MQRNLMCLRTIMQCFCCLSTSMIVIPLLQIEIVKMMVTKQIIWYVLYLNIYFMFSGMDLLSYKLREPAYLIPVLICRLPLAFCATTIDALDYNLFVLWMRKTYYFVILVCALLFFMFTQISNTLDANLYVDNPVLGRKMNILQQFQSSCFYVILLMGKALYQTFRFPRCLAIVTTKVQSSSIRKSVHMKRNPMGKMQLRLPTMESDQTIDENNNHEDVRMHVQLTSCDSGDKSPG